MNGPARRSSEKPRTIPIDHDWLLSKMWLTHQWLFNAEGNRQLPISLLYFEVCVIWEWGFPILYRFIILYFLASYRNYFQEVSSSIGYSASYKLRGALVLKQAYRRNPHKNRIECCHYWVDIIMLLRTKNLWLSKSLCLSWRTLRFSVSK